MKRIHLDFETFSTLDLKKVGLHRYAEHESTEILCFSWCVGSGKTQLWVSGDPFPAGLFQSIDTGVYMLCAFNAEFEIEIWDKVCHERFGWPALPKELWTDTQTDCLGVGLPDSLEKAALALKVIQQKDPKGKKLIKELCAPHKPSVKDPSIRWTRDSHPDKFLDLYRYCRQDVKTERAVHQALPYHITGIGQPAREMWLMTVTMNKRGVPIDVPAAMSIQEKIEKKQEIMDIRLHKITGGNVEKTTQRERLRNFLNNEQGLSLPDLQNTTVDEALEREDLSARSRELLQLRKDANHPSTSKYKKILKMICNDGTVKGNLKFHGASTGRFTSKGFQFQNLPSASTPYVDQMIEAFSTLDIESIELLFGDLLHCASVLLRPMISAPEGWKLINNDLKSIEARMAAWVAKEEHILQAFRDNLDLYKVSAAEMYSVDYEKITKDQRASGKIAVLACGFQGAYAAIMSMAEKLQIPMEITQAKSIVAKFRRARPLLVKSWRAFGKAAERAVRNPGYDLPVETNDKFSFKCKGRYLFMKMPNMRRIVFYDPKWMSWPTPWGKSMEQVTAMWMNSQKGKKWERRSISGASFLQSAVQGLAGDVLQEAQLRLESSIFPLVSSVHDECTSLVPDDPRYNRAQFDRLFLKVPAWCPDLPLGCEGWEGKRYRK